MIEYKLRYPNFDSDEWQTYLINWPLPNKVRFAVYIFRIDGTEYDAPSKEFTKAFKGDMIWAKLTKEHNA